MKYLPAKIWLIIVFLGGKAAAQHQAGIIDVYGLKKVKEATVLKALGIAEGDSTHLRISELKRRLLTVKGVKDGDVNFICCDAGKEVLYVGISEEKAKARGEYRRYDRHFELPDTLFQVADRYFRALNSAVAKGDNREDFVHGYSLFRNPAVRQIQMQFTQLANAHFDLLVRALRQDTSADNRVLAAMFLPYAEDKRVILRELNRAAVDPSPEVRNNVFRAFGALGSYLDEHTEIRSGIRTDVFIQMLRSAHWSDRDKAMFALMVLTERRSVKLLTALKTGASRPLAEMTKWKSRNHALMACVILGRIAGWTDEAIYLSWSANDHKLLTALGLE